MTCARILALCLPLCGFIAVSPARSEDAPPPIVGRVAAAEGGASLRPRGGAWANSALNDPVAAGMTARTGGQGRAVLRLGGDTVALAAGSEIDLQQLDASGTGIVLRQGRIAVRLSAADPAHSVEIDAPRGQVWLLTPGSYDIAAGDQQGPGRLTVVDGHARFVGKGVDTAAAAGETIALGGGAVAAAAAAPDDFAQWWRAAGEDHADSPALRYVSPEMTGYAVLDGAGGWETVAGSGAVWFPARLPDNWAPYRYGRWRWAAPWGWTWIDDAAWGFAPSHYGRWALFPGADGKAERWGWAPGRRTAHPAYLPAAVAFLGTAGIGLSYPDATGPAIGWFPLAPGEAYWPNWTRDIAAIRRLNDGSVADPGALAPGADGGPPADIVDGDYKYRRYASVVPRPVFLGGKPVPPSLIKLPPQRLDNAPLLAGSPQIAPAAPSAVEIAVAATVPRLVSAVRTLARILRPHEREIAVRLAGAHAARPRIVHAVFIRAAHPHVRLADVRRAR